LEVEDVTVLVRMELALPRDARYVGVMREVAGCILEQLNAPPDAISDVQIAVTEACANAVRHAVGSAEYSVRLGVDDQACEIEIIDVGPGFTPDIEVGQDLQVDMESESGRGLYLIRALVDDLQFERDGGNNKVRLTKRFEAITDMPAAGDGLPSDLR
jgi:serine/threonine-protein kinase RsbW